MKVYIWESGYGGRHVIAVANSIEEAISKIETQIENAKSLIKEMDESEYMSGEWFLLLEEKEKIAHGEGVFSVPDISENPTYILECSDIPSESVCLQLGNDS